MDAGPDFEVLQQLEGKRPGLEKALAAYKKAAEFPESQVYAFALYKQGWCKPASGVESASGPGRRGAAEQGRQAA